MDESLRWELQRPKGTYNGRLFTVWEISFLQKTPRLSQQTGVPSLREETTRARAPKLYRPLQHRCTTGARAPKPFFITLIYESVQELIILQIA